VDFRFCGGYVDADDAAGSDELAPRSYRTSLLTVTDDWAVKGLSQEQGVALLSATNVGSQYYKDLLSGDSSSVTETELLEDGDLKAIVETFASDEAALLQAFESGWTYMMTADRFTVSSLAPIVIMLIHLLTRPVDIVRTIARTLATV